LQIGDTIDDGHEGSRLGPNMTELSSMPFRPAQHFPGHARLARKHNETAMAGLAPTL
jgi:hypothetical protein